MSSITFDDLLEKIKSYNSDNLEMVKKAYNLAFDAHRGQVRKSGEPYITHPINVAYILADMMADTDTICAALLHDTIEDTSVTKADIEKNFNETIANLVDGVSKIKNINFSNNEEEYNANLHKLITSITTDIRILIIKLADRLHNMRTLEYKEDYKQKQKSLETLQIFSPLAERIGSYRMKKELEDLSLKFLKPDIYYDIKNQRDSVINDTSECIDIMKSLIGESLHKELNIDNKIGFHAKNIYGIYKSMKTDNLNIEQIHDLLVIKILLNNISDCYLSLMKVHELYFPINYYFKDYICNPKTNLYQALHTTVFGQEDRLVQCQIQTHDMGQIASFGLPAYWRIYQDKAVSKMQKKAEIYIPFYKLIDELDNLSDSNKEFVDLVFAELLANNIYVRSRNGEKVELPVGSTPFDFACKVGIDIKNNYIKAYVNDVEVPLDYELKNDDIINIILLEQKDSKQDFNDFANTKYARVKYKKTF